MNQGIMHESYVWQHYQLDVNDLTTHLQRSKKFKSAIDKLKITIPIIRLNKGVCHIVVLPFTLNSISRQKKNSKNSNISPCKKSNLQKIF
jgi:hypothetical protein